MGHHLREGRCAPATIFKLQAVPDAERAKQLVRPAVFTIEFKLYDLGRSALAYCGDGDVPLLSPEDCIQGYFASKRITAALQHTPPVDQIVRRSRSRLDHHRFIDKLDMAVNEAPASLGYQVTYGCQFGFRTVCGLTPSATHSPRPSRMRRCYDLGLMVLK